MVPRNWTQENPQFSNTLEIYPCSLLHVHLDRSSSSSPFRGFPWAVCSRKWVISPLHHTAGKKLKGQQQWDLLSRNQVSLPKVSRGSWSLLCTFNKLVTWTNNHKFTMLSIPEVDKPVRSWISEGPSTELALLWEHVNVATQANQPPKMSLFHSSGAPEQCPKCVSLQEPWCCSLSSFLLWMRHSSHWGYKSQAVLTFGSESSSGN